MPARLPPRFQLLQAWLGRSYRQPKSPGHPAWISSLLVSCLAHHSPSQRLNPPARSAPSHACDLMTSWMFSSPDFHPLKNTALSWKVILLNFLGSGPLFILEEWKDPFFTHACSKCALSNYYMPGRMLQPGTQQAQDRCSQRPIGLSPTHWVTYPLSDLWEIIIIFFFFTRTQSLHQENRGSWTRRILGSFLALRSYNLLRKTPPKNSLEEGQD